MQQMNSTQKLNEHLSENDLKWLVDDTVLIDMHKTKLGEDKDYIVLSIAAGDRTPAHDLARFIENSIHKYADVEVSPATDTKGRYLIYVEMKRDEKAFEVINGILTDCTKLTGIEEWKFKTMSTDSYIPFDRESFNQSVITDPALYAEQHAQEVDSNEEETTNEVEPSLVDPVQESIKTRLKFLMKY